jgi:hypothetical protein
VGSTATINPALMTLRLLLGGGSFGSCLRVHLRGAGKVAGGHQHHAYISMGP